MAQQKAASKKAPPEFRVAGPDFKGLLLLLFSIVTLLALLGLGPGRLNTPIASALRWLVGWGAYPLTLLVGVAGFLVLSRYKRERPANWGQILAIELLMLCVLGMSTLLQNPDLSWGLATTGVGGGALGWLVASLAAIVGTTGGLVLLVLLSLLLIPTVSGMPLERLQWLLAQQQQRLHRQRTRLLAPMEAAPAAPIALPRSAPVSPPPAAAPKATASPPLQAAPDAPKMVEAKSKKRPDKSKEATKESVLERVKQVVSKTTTPAPPSRSAARAPKQAQGGGFELPPLDLLNRAVTNTLDPNIAREKARVIEKTLSQFGVPANVVQVNQGPAVTQFGVQPGFVERTLKDGTVRKLKVKVSKITSLADDLALALAAKSIRVEAPVPGRPYVGIEVPNSDTEMVTLHSVLTSEEFKKLGSQLAFALGRDVSGKAVAADLARMPHLLIAGATGAGKSVCVNTIIASLLFNLTPDSLKLLMIDPKMVELIPYNGIPHLIAPVVTDMERAVGALTWAMREMDRRYKLFSEAGKRNLESYNQHLVSQGEQPLPFIVIIIDELADLMMVAADQVERIICRIAQMARATGMHLILATQRPSVDVVTGLIKANIPARISFAVASQIDSRVILDTNGAEALLGRGDMLFQAPDSSKLHRLQGCFVSDAELNKVVQHWLRNPKPRTGVLLNDEALEADEAPWEEILEEMGESDQQEDELLPDAIAVVREHQWASTSFLQRKLRIGYTRAARLVDTLEAKGIIGPPEEGSNGSRVVIVETGGKASVGSDVDEV